MRDGRPGVGSGPTGVTLCGSFSPSVSDVDAGPAAALDAGPGSVVAAGPVADGASALRDVEGRTAVPGDRVGLVVRGLAVE